MPTSLSHEIQGTKVHGLQVDKRTGCAHYRSELDIIAIQFKCCQLYYSCFACHQAMADHLAEQWQPSEFDCQAILCGSCGGLLTINEYLQCAYHCIYCSVNFNPNCQQHYHLYFANFPGYKQKFLPSAK